MNQKIEEQIRRNFKNAMRDKLNEICKKEELNSEDVEWIGVLCEELVFRINQLTPNRKDLCDELQKSIDVGLLKQMLKHNAFESSDIQNMIGIILSRLKMLCAPSQDNEICKLENKLRSLPTEDTIPAFIWDANVIIDEIEFLKDQFLNSEKKFGAVENG